MQAKSSTPGDNLACADPASLICNLFNQSFANADKALIAD